MSSAVSTLLYLASASLFILGLKRLSSPVTARSGNLMGAVGMLIAIVVTLLRSGIVDYTLIVAGFLVGGIAGTILARRVAMTGIPQLVAAFNGFGGAASGMVAAAEFLADGSSTTETAVTITISCALGIATFTGSFVAFGKLQGLIPGRPLLFRGQMVFDSALATAVVGSGVWMASSGSRSALWLLIALAALLGVTRTLPIGGADMPVIVAFLNSMSGLAAASTGFVIGSEALIISGALVGASGLVLTAIMSRAMNRSLANVLFAAFGGDNESQPEGIGAGPVRRATVDDAAVTLAYARSVIVVPGYGLAVSQAQYGARDLTDRLAGRGVEVRYAIHPVAGRMPGHMNVLLAEADVPYEQLLDLDEINDDFPRTDVALVVGANDEVNPAARDDPSSPIFGMPILDVDRAGAVIVVKRSLSPGFAGIDNPLFYRDTTLMLFSDAKAALESLASAVQTA